MKIGFHPEAIEEFVAAVSFYESRIPGFGNLFAEEVRRTAQVLLEQPSIGTLVDPEVRKIALRRFPFSIYYSVTSEELRIEVVAHQRRAPDYWKSRRS